jgi:hypothetical protein
MIAICLKDAILLLDDSLGDLLRHVETETTHRGVFASSLGARDLEELQTHAVTKELLDARLARSQDLKSQFLEHVLTLCDSDPEPQGSPKNGQ